MSGRVSGKVIIVTGAAAGLGAAIAARLAEEGATVVRTDIMGGDGVVRQDVTDEGQWQALIAEVVGTHGRLDGLVNNAGIADGKGPPDPEGALAEDWRRIYTVNVEGVFLGCKHAIPAIAAVGGGAIVNMSSIGALVPTPFLSAYGASKAAVMQFTRSVALHCCEQGHAIRCNSVHPGQVRTPMHDELIARTAAEHGLDAEQAAQAFLSKVPMKKWQEAVDIANGVLFLMSDEARFVTGTSLVVDGGMSLTN
ncbi:SDR family oxidoreductase [Sphingomonas sp. C8-2]|jgi:NAD(P)-dependent dehydrogenase (short-subunit alcohol dehydrogenase family)|nr:SDR family oxidoreductase [Sphingomonas sp. C8-2]